MLQVNEIRDLMKIVAKANPSMSYSYNNESLSYAALNETLRQELDSLTGSYALWRENKNTVFSLLEEVIDDILPTRVLERYGQFAETKVFAQGDKPIFTHKLGRARAKQFITRVGLAGVYEVFKLGEENFELQTSAIGGAIQIGFEEFLDGRVDFSELLEILMEGMDELIYREIAAALTGAIAQMPTSNFHQDTEFDEVAFDKLLSVASAYGRPSIYCTFEFAATMLPSTGWVSDEMRNQRWTQGYIGNYKGAQVIVLPQSFEDETNTTKVIDPSFAFIIPAGTNGKPVKVAFEGQTHMREVENADWSRNIDVYRKVGVGVIMTNNICIYENTSLEK